MKFGKQFHHLSPPAFAPYNIAYQVLKKAIPIIIGDAESADAKADNKVLSEFGPQDVGSAGRPPETRFNALLMHEVNKVARCVDLHILTWMDEVNEVLRNNPTTEQLDKLARDLEDLDLYRRLNHTAFRKITKKFDKMVKNRVAEGGFGKWFMSRLEQHPLMTQSIDWMVALLDLGYVPSAVSSNEPLMSRTYWMPASVRAKVLTTLVKHLNIHCTSTHERERAAMRSSSAAADLTTEFRSRQYAAYFDTDDFEDAGGTSLQWSCGLHEGLVGPPSQFDVELHSSQGIFLGSRQQWEDGSLGPSGALKGRTLKAASGSRRLVFRDDHGTRVVLDESIVFGPMKCDGNAVNDSNRTSVDTETDKCRQTQPPASRSTVFDDIWNRIGGDAESDILNEFPLAVLEVQTKGEPAWLSELQGRGILREVSNFKLGQHVAATLSTSRTFVRPDWFTFLCDAFNEEPEVPEVRPSLQEMRHTSTSALVFPSFHDVQSMVMDEDGPVITRDIADEPTFPLIEPKGFLANERTFLSWSRIFIIIFSVSLGMLQTSIQRKDTSVLSAFALVTALFSVGGTFTALWIFLDRHKAIRTHDITAATFCNPIFPGVVTCYLSVVLVCNIALA